MDQVSTLKALVLGYSSKLSGEQQFLLKDMPDILSVRTELTRRMEERFGLNGMHVVRMRIDGVFEKVDARSEAPYRLHHIMLKEMLGKTQKAFVFEKIREDQRRSGDRS